MVAADLFSVLDNGDASASPFCVIEFPGQPRGKGRPRSRVVQQRGKAPWVQVYTDSETRAYERALSWQAKAAMKGRAPLTGPLAVRVFAIMRIPPSWSRRDRDAAAVGTKLAVGKPDGDNIFKVVDSFNGIVWVDDTQIVRHLVVKEFGESPGLIVEVYTLP